MSTPVKLRIFIVDDDAMARSVVRDQLRGIDADIAEFADGDACMAAMDRKPDIVLLDVEMPGTDGIGVCARLRSSGYADVEVIFVSAHDDLETRLAARGAGGNDYLVKPCARDDLVKSVQVATRAIRARREADAHVRSARLAFAADQAAAGGMAVVLAFQRASFVCWTVEELGIALCDALAQCGLHALVELRPEDGRHCYSSRGRMTALEASILDHVRGLEQVFQFHDRLTLQYRHVTVLIPNLPLAEYDRAMDLHDHLAVLAGCAEARFSAIAGMA